MSSANGLPGAFGSGATFAMEDGWILALSLRDLLLDRHETLWGSLNRLYQHLDDSDKIHNF
ncbi:hypothetical protein N7489_001501 [Penicillium chrysogenum]|uniref:Uncharacterized protein n=1 Tax=Penicillium chrysogenum TaxID=5076 RepID=A0ABQ8WIT9_PENCH|nr:uncharacterized protein N7489_001501 [Penicillium chrysogenum]KAJ5251091.1 hypothetical protein N7489_001501 [Penicillium chrysogenum]KAJ5262528.1 hypothetical protein N7524_007833 [Penicillium chrysogenum]KAJ5269992.1 hypothetical protein N7505_005750 [Penicillium chrysogenum]KAJ6147274.1 hypothetical protein N7497_009256 [Penicillium chrysogenum]